jgi:ribosomal protein S8
MCLKVKDKIDCNEAAELGCLECLKIAHTYGIYPPNGKTFALAAKGGHLDCLKYMYEHNRHISEYNWDDRVCYVSAREGHLDCLKYAVEHDCPWDEFACLKVSHPNCIDYIKDMMCFKHSKDSLEAVKHGCLKCLKIAHNKGVPWHEDTCSIAAEGGHLDCLHYAIKNGAPYDGKAYALAASNDHLDCLRYLYEANYIQRWDKDTCTFAAMYGTLKCLKYAVEHGCPINEEACFKVSHPNCKEYLKDMMCFKHSKDCIEAVKHGCLKCLKIAHNNGAPWNQESDEHRKVGIPYILKTCAIAAEGGHLECLKYAHENGAPWDKDTCTLAASDGHLKCLQYAHENGCPWNEYTCAMAAAHGHLDCLKYAHENGCPWDEHTCLYASIHLDCLKYAHENGCPWDERTCSWASHLGSLECLKYAHKNGCPIDTDYCLQFSKTNCKGYLEGLKKEDHIQDEPTETKPIQCCVCLVNRICITFNCTHTTCYGCSKKVEQCPICRVQIKDRIVFRLN